MTTSTFRRYLNSFVLTTMLVPASGAFGATTNYTFPPQEPTWNGSHAVLQGTEGNTKVTLGCGMARDPISKQILPLPDTNWMTKTQDDTSIRHERTNQGMAGITAVTGTLVTMTVLKSGTEIIALAGNAQPYTDGTIGLSGSGTPVASPFSAENFNRAAKEMRALCKQYGPGFDWMPPTAPKESSAQIAYAQSQFDRFTPFRQTQPTGGQSQQERTSQTKAPAYHEQAPAARHPSSRQLNNEQKQERHDGPCAAYISDEDRARLGKTTNRRRPLVRPVQFYKFPSFKTAPSQ